MSRFGVALLVASLLTAASLDAQSTAAFKPWTIREAPEELRPMVSRADLIIVAMHNSLLRQLGDQLARGGPELALSACHMEPTELARRMRRGAGVAAGFTGDRLRNPSNTPRPWASGIVAAYAGRRALDVDGFVVDLGEKVGVLRPIAQQHLCASCHGPVERIGPAVRGAVAKRYPADRALGFSEGEIRGWYWVEISKGG